MPSSRMLPIWTFAVCLAVWFTVASAHAQSKSAAPQITVYESPT